jgi:type VI secretion system protein ImpF
MSSFRANSGDLKEVPPSVLERLRGGEETERSATDLRVDVEAMRLEVLAHVNAILNTRLAELEGIERFPEAGRSLLAYGVPDLSTYFEGSQEDRHRLVNHIERAIRLFEPRLDPQALKVERVHDGGDAGLQERYRIHATLRVHPFKKQVTFDTRVQLKTGNISVGEPDA